MKKQFLIGLMLVAALTGCDSDSTNVDLLGNAATPPGVSGRVVGEGGASISGARIVAQERTTRQEVEVASRSDGGFDLVLPQGVYDVVVEHESDPTKATSYYGPVTVDSALRQDFVLHETGGRNAETVFGKILTRDDIPASGRLVTLRPGFISGGALTNDTMTPQTVTTGSDGSFEISMGGPNEMGLDVEVADASGALDEFIDVGKMSKPCYVEFAVEQSPIENSLRCNEELQDTPGIVAQTNPIDPSVVQRFDVAIVNNSIVMSGGRLPPNTPTMNLEDLAVSIPSDSNFDKLIGIFNNLDGVATISTGGRFFLWKYRVTVEAYGEDEIHWAFTDATNDTYHLSVYLNEFVGPHFVSYNSSDPTIEKIEFRI